MSTDRVVSLSAMAVGVLSLFVVAYQTYLTRQAQYASVLPYLYFSLSSNPQDGVAIRITNSGVGPAVVDDIRIHYQGREIPGDPYDFFVGLQKDPGALALGVDKVLPGRLIPAGTTISMLNGSDGQKLLPEFLRHFEIAEVPRRWYEALGLTGSSRAVIEITYASVYGERWRIRSDQIVPQRF